MSFNFAVRIFEYRRFTQSLNNSLSAFNSFVPETIDPVLKADIYGQQIDDNCKAIHTAEELLQKIENVFRHIGLAVLKQSMSKDKFTQNKVSF